MGLCAATRGLACLCEPATYLWCDHIHDAI